MSWPMVVLLGVSGCGGARAPHPGEGAPTTSSLPATPGRADIVEAMNAVQSSVTACGDGAGGSIAVAVELASDGTVREASVLAPDPTYPVVPRDVRGTPIEPCVVAALRGVRTRPFARESFRFSYQLRIR